MIWLRGALALLLGSALFACVEDVGVPTGGGGCPPGGSCQGADDCYSACYCETEDTASCERRCGERGVRVQDLDASAWLADWIAREDEVVRLTNALRAEGGCCGNEGCFDPAPPLGADAELQSSARAHALDMAEQDYFDHDSQDGRSPFDRMREAGFRGCALGENIAAGQETPESVVEGWRDSPGHCANILSPGFDRIGVGYHPAETGARHLWVQNFGG